MLLVLNAAVSKSKAILLGDSVACDAHEDGREVRVVTHAHYDHVLGLKESLRRCKVVYATPLRGTCSQSSTAGGPRTSYR